MGSVNPVLGFSGLLVFKTKKLPNCRSSYQLQKNNITYLLHQKYIIIQQQIEQKFVDILNRCCLHITKDSQRMSLTNVPKIAHWQQQTLYL